MTGPDFLLWEALHEACDDGCGGCTVLEVDDDTAVIMHSLMKTSGQTASEVLRRAVEAYIRKFAA